LTGKVNGEKKSGGGEQANEKLGEGGIINTHVPGNNARGCGNGGQEKQRT